MIKQIDKIKEYAKTILYANMQNPEIDDYWISYNTEIDINIYLYEGLNGYTKYKATAYPIRKGEYTDTSSWSIELF